MTPILAMMLGAGLIIQAYQDQGQRIEITFPAAAGIKADSTTIKYLEVEIGRITEMRLSDDREAVVAVAELDPDVEDFLVEDSTFWLVRPQVTLAGVSALETLLSGQYIALVPGASKRRSAKFEGQLNPPIGASHPGGLALILETPNLGSLSQGVGVYHRNVRVGEVEHYELPNGADPVEIYVMIYETYRHLVREDSLFWHASGIDVEVGFGGLRVETEGVGAVLAGGIAFSSMASSPPLERDDARFVLHDSSQAANRSRRENEGMAFRLEARSAEALGKGTPIVFRGVEVGHVGRSALTLDAQGVQAQAFLFAEYRNLLRSNSRFFAGNGLDVDIGFEGVSIRSPSLQEIAEGDIHLAVPDALEAAAKPGALYPLESPGDRSWRRWSPPIEITAEGAAAIGASDHRFRPNLARARFRSRWSRIHEAQRLGRQCYSEAYRSGESSPRTFHGMAGGSKSQCESIRISSGSSERTRGSGTFRQSTSAPTRAESKSLSVQRCNSPSAASCWRTRRAAPLAQSRRGPGPCSTRTRTPLIAKNGTSAC